MNTQSTNYFLPPHHSQISQRQSQQNYLASKLQEWLLMSISAKSNEEIKFASSNIQANYLAIGFIPSLIQIIYQHINKVQDKLYQSLLLSTLALMKNVVRKYWRSQRNSIHAQDKDLFIHSIIDLNIKVASIQNHQLSYKYRKMLKDVISISRQDCIKIFPQIVSIIDLSDQENRLNNLPFCLNILLGLSNSPQIFNTQYYESLTQMIKSVHPHLFGFIKQGQSLIHSTYDKFNEVTTAEQGRQLTKIYYEIKRKYQQILYLSIKFMFRAINNECVDNYREIALQWAEIAIKKTEVQSFPQQIISNNSDKDQMGSKGNDRFNYYHGKKWALKYLKRLFDRVLLLRNNKTNYNQQTLNFYKENLDWIVQNFKQTWAIYEPDRIKHYQLKCFQKLLSFRPRYFAINHQNQMKNYLTNILPSFMKMTQKQIQIIQNDPIEFISFESNYGFFSGQMKSSRMVAFQVWMSIAKLTQNIQNYEQNTLLKFSLEVIAGWIQSDNAVLMEMGCFLLCKLNQSYLRVGSLKSYVIAMVMQTINNNLPGYNHYILRARAFDLMSAFGDQFELSYLKQMQFKVFQQYSSLKNLNSLNQLSSSQIFLLIKACSAFRHLIRRQYLTTQQIKLIIFLSFELMRITNFEDIIYSINRIVASYINETEQFAVEIINFIRDWFKKYVELQTQRIYSEKKTVNFDGISQGIMDFITTLAELVRGGNEEIIQAIENEICNMADYLLTNGNQDINYELKQDLILLLQTFLANHPHRRPLSPKICLVCRMVLIRIAGIIPSVIKYIKEKGQQNRSYMHKYYLLCSDGIRIGLQHFLGMVRNFLKFIEFGGRIGIFKDILSNILNEKASSTEHIFYMIYRLFNHKQNEGEYNNQPKCFALHALIYYYEAHQRNHCQQRVHQSVNRSTLKIICLSLKLVATSPKILKLNTQLFSLWIYENQAQLSTYFSSWSESSLCALFSRIFIYENYYGLPEMSTSNQKSRCIYGVCSLLKLAFTHQSLLRMIQPKLSSLIHYVIAFTYDLMSQTQEQYLREQQAGLKQYLSDKEEDLTAVPVDNVGTEKVSKSQMGQDYYNQDYESLIIYQFSNISHYQADDEQDFYDMEESEQQQRYYSPLLLAPYQLQLFQTLCLIRDKNRSYYENEVRKKHNRKIQEMIQSNSDFADDEYQKYIDLYSWSDEDEDELSP